jgi:hypothetical protein
MANQENHLLADFSGAPFVDVPGNPNPTQISIMPLVAIKNGVPERIVGTCFAVSNDGLALTARHSIDDALGRRLGEGTFDETKFVAAIYYSNQEHETESGRHQLGGLLPITKCIINENFDIALLHLNLPINTITNERLPMPANPVSMKIPKVGSLCFGLGYRAASLVAAEGQPNTLILDQRYSATKGIISDIHFPKRDSSMLSFPCARINARFDGGMSGGPVIDESGKVIGVVCSSFGANTDELPLSYFSLLGPALSLSIVAKHPDGAERPTFLYDLLHMDTSDSGVKVEKLDDRIVMDFGLSAKIENRLGVGD